MKKILFSSLFLTSLLFSESFEHFLERALIQNAQLKASKLEIEVTKTEGEALLRQQNPTLSADYSRFDPQGEEREDGYNLNLSQPLRLWGVGEDKRALSMLQKEASEFDYHDKKARFIRDLSLRFINYAKLERAYLLGKESEKIAKNIYTIAKRRYGAGKIAQKELLQTKLSLQKQQLENETLALQVEKSYFEMLELAGLDSEIKPDFYHHFRLQSSHKDNPTLRYLQTQERLLLAKAKLETKTLTEITLNANYEKEPEQDISSLGISLPLALFNQKREEKQIAKLKIKQSAYLIQQAKNLFILKIKRLNAQREQLIRLKKRYKKTLQTSQQLLTMFQEGYRISKSNLLELQQAKNTLIETKKALLNTEATLERNIIITNYMQGAYHD